MTIIKMLTPNCSKEREKKMFAPYLDEITMSITEATRPHVAVKILSPKKTLLRTAIFFVLNGMMAIKMILRRLMMANTIITCTTTNKLSMVPDPEEEEEDDSAIEEDEDAIP